MNIIKRSHDLIVAAMLAALLQFWPNSAYSQTAEKPDPADVQSAEKEACAKQLKAVYEAIQAYRKDHKQLPNWLSDLVPDHLADASTLICPVTKRTGKGIPYKNLADPKIASSYVYEFSDAAMGPVWHGGKMKMRDFKSLQMGVIGGDTPILRCLLHAPMLKSPALNIGFDGKYYESPWNWEELYRDVFNFDDLAPEKLLARYSGISAPTAPTPPPAAPVRVGSPAPKLQTGKWVQGEPVQEFQPGKAYLVEFWATWCGPCRVSIPHLNEIHAKYKDKGLVVIGQDCWEQDEKLVPPFLKTMGSKMTYRVALDDKESSQTGKMAETWMAAAGQRGIPTAFLVDTKGRIAWIGHPMTLEERLIDNVLAEKAGASASNGRSN